LSDLPEEAARQTATALAFETPFQCRQTLFMIELEIYLRFGQVPNNEDLSIK